MFSASLRERAAAVIALYEERGLTLATAESCTGGLISALMTETPGSSKVFERGFVTYSNRSKEELLGVAPDLIDRYGAVSSEVAVAMAEGALEHSAAIVALSVTGVAGPDGGTAAKPIGLVYFGYGRTGQIATLKKKYGDIGRSEVRMASVETALDLLFNAASF
jgi:nicotinamide-nucleotide amidase